MCGGNEINFVDYHSRRRQSALHKNIVALPLVIFGVCLAVFNGKTVKLVTFLATRGGQTILRWVGAWSEWGTFRVFEIETAPPPPGPGRARFEWGQWGGSGGSLPPPHSEMVIIDP